MPFWHRLFWAADTEDPAASRRAFISPLTTYRNLDRGPGPERELSPELTLVWMAYLYGGQTSSYQTTAFPPRCELHMEPQVWSPRPVPHFWASHSIQASAAQLALGLHILGGLQMSKIQNLCFPCQSILKQFNLIIRPAKETRRVEGEIFPLIWILQVSILKFRVLFIMYLSNRVPRNEMMLQ